MYLVPNSAAIACRSVGRLLAGYAGVPKDATLEREEFDPMSTAIVYYSLSNNTRTVAEILAERTGGALIRLEENTSRGGFFGFLKSGFQAATRRMSRLSGEPWEAVRPFDTLYLLTPIWASNGTPAMNAFLSKADLEGKTATIITLQADPDKDGSDKVHDHIRSIVEKKGAAVASAYALHSASPGQFAGKEYLAAQVDNLLPNDM